MLKAFACCVALAGLFLSTGCNKEEQQVQLDEKTIEELKAFDGELEESKRQSFGAGSPNVVSASSDALQTSPVNGTGQFDPTVANMPAQTTSGLTRNSLPEEVCAQFLAALADGDYVAAHQMLTNVAQIETARANLQLESPGDEGASYEIQPAQYATVEKKVAQVTCILRQPYDEAEVRLTWIMRHQYNGWKISGMSIQMEPNGASDLLSFENPNDLNRIQNSVSEETAPHTRTVQETNNADSIRR